MITFDQFVAEQAESRREFLKKLGKGLAAASSGIKPDLSAAKKVAKVSNYVHRDAKFDAYDALNYALDNMFEFGRAESDLSMPLDLQQRIGNKLQYSIIGHKYYAVPGGPSSLRPTDYDFYSSLIDNAEDYGDMDEAIASSSATLQDVFDYPKIFKGADNIWREKGRAGIEEIEDYIKNNVEGYIEADNEGDTCYEGEPEPVDEDPRDYLERDYASGPHMNSFKPVMSFNQFYLTEMASRRTRDTTITAGNRFGRSQGSLDLDELIKQGHAAGKSAPEIGEELGVSSKVVLKRAAIMDPPLKFPMLGGAPKRLQLDNDLIKQGHAEGKSAQEIGEELGVTYGTIYDRAKNMDPPLKFKAQGTSPTARANQLMRRNLPVPGQDQIKQGHDEGRTAADIAIDLRVNPTTVRNRANRMNPPLKFPRTGGPGLKRVSHLRDPSKMRTRHTGIQGNVGGAHQTQLPTVGGIPGKVNTNMPGPKGGKGH
jgi:hypothetical protein